MECAPVKHRSEGLDDLLKLGNLTARPIAEHLLYLLKTQLSSLKLMSQSLVSPVVRFAPQACARGLGVGRSGWPFGLPRSDGSPLGLVTDTARDRHWGTCPFRCRETPVHQLHAHVFQHAPFTCSGRPVENGSFPGPRMQTALRCPA